MAVGGGFVVLQPETGPDSGFGQYTDSDDCAVQLNDPALNATYPLSVCVQPDEPALCPAWSATAIVASLPAALQIPPLPPPPPGLPGTADSRTFTITVRTASGTIFKTGELWIVGVPGSGYPTSPPMHHLEGRWTLLEASHHAGAKSGDARQPVG